MSHRRGKFDDLVLLSVYSFTFCPLPVVIFFELISIGRVVTSDSNRPGKIILDSSLDDDYHHAKPAWTLLLLILNKMTYDVIVLFLFLNRRSQAQRCNPESGVFRLAAERREEVSIRQSWLKYGKYGTCHSKISLSTQGWPRGSGELL